MTIEELYKRIDGDYNDVKRRLASDRLITKIVTKFPQDPSYDALVSAWQSKNDEDIFSAAHTLKGVTVNLSFTELFVISSEITEMYRLGNESSKDEEKTAELMKALKERYNLTIDCIEEFIASNN